MNLTRTARFARVWLWLGSVLLLGGCASGLRVDTRYVSVNQDSRAQFLVLHYTVGNFESALATLTQPSSRAVSSHYLVRDDPVQIYRLVDEDRRAWHAGPSYWQGHNHLNASSIGIEIVNPGWVRAPDGSRQYAPFAPAQIDAVIALCQDIVARHHIKPERIVGHADIAPGRKQDPGPLFPWKRLALAGLIAWPNEAQVQAVLPRFEAQLPDASWFQDKLADVGYNTSRSGHWDDLTRDSLVGFQMRYRPQQYDGVPDALSAALLFVATAPGGMVQLAAPEGARPRATSRW